MPITHKFVSAKTDADDTTLVRPSNWNEEHEFSDLTINSDDITYTLNEISSSTTLTEDYYVVLVDGTATVTLPASVSHANRVYTIKNIGTGMVTVDANGTETMDGEQAVSLNLQYQYITIICDGTEWFIVGGEYVKINDLLRQILIEVEKLNKTAKETKDEVEKIND